MQHQAFTAGAHDLVEPTLQFVAAGHRGLRHRLQLRPAQLACQAFEQPGARRERPRRDRRVEDHVADLPPFVVARPLAPHGRRQRVEAAAAQPQLAVQRRRRQALSEPWRRRHRAATAEEQPAAVPDRARAVELLAHQEAGGVDAGGRILRQQQRQFPSGPSPGAGWQRGHAGQEGAAAEGVHGGLRGEVVTRSLRHSRPAGHRPRDGVGPPLAGAPAPDQVQRRSASTAFKPPKANEFDNAAATGRCCATLGTTSRSHSGSGSR